MTHLALVLASKQHPVMLSRICWPSCSEAFSALKLMELHPGYCLPYYQMHICISANSRKDFGLRFVL